jgi:hypothetical protein
MDIFRRRATAFLAALALSGCASIVGDSENTIPISSNPVGAEVTIANQDGVEVYRGTTPATVTLDTGGGYFDDQAYLITIAMDGYAPQTVSVGTELNAWYVGNVVIGGPIGLLIVDPLTGAMWKLDRRHVNLELPPSVAAGTSRPQIRVVALGDVPLEARSAMVRVDEPTARETLPASFSETGEGR